MAFSTRILAWYKQHKRALPWRETEDPYVIWLSEIILQQTRVEQGLPYFLRFVEAYPNVTSFASAEESDILRLWQGLGYYSRARNMHKAAKKVMEVYEGVFPTDYQQLLDLPGIGPYTAAAIASFSTNQAHAVLDGNVFRVLSRYFGIDEPINSGAGKKLFTRLAEKVLDPLAAGEYNQAIMDFGALQCKPKSPNCEQCVLRLDCRGFVENRVSMLPVKIRKQKIRDRYFHYFVIQKADYVMMSQRRAGDIWENLYEFPMIETAAPVTLPELMQQEEFQAYFADAELRSLGPAVRHLLSHQRIYAHFYVIEWSGQQGVKKSHWDYHLLENLDKLAKHKLISSFVERYFSAH
ncbi:MAG TPA: A/G-specific adenine glycosylase [Candidatus Sphingobacterium stercorigallinarum]|nr:A/G-specific adenine glycosylase [Candidatus Sphingobacterium stercorigallinarum]